MKKGRYLSQRIFTGIGEKGQELLKEGRVLLVGCGALGTVNAQFLARAGVGYLRLVDEDQVELANLHRQVLFDESDAEAGILKVHVAKKRLKEINSEVSIEIHDYYFTEDNMDILTEGIDIIIDCTDNFSARRLIDQAALKKGIPWVYGGVAGSVGMVKFVSADRGETMEDFLDIRDGSNILTTCRDGVINTVPGVVASLQSTETIKFLTGQRKDINKKMVYFDLWNNDWDMFDLD